MSQHTIGPYSIGNNQPMCLIAGPCVVESEDLMMQIAEVVATMAQRHAIPVVFKASIDKANRTALHSFRGIGMEKSLRILEKVKNDFALPILTDVHNEAMVTEVAEVVDILQIPAFLCRQTDLLLAAAATSKPINIKKGQFLAPADMRHVLAKAKSSGNADIMLCERGTTFGYNNLVVDFRGLAIMRELGQPVIFDATHSVQLPGAGDGKSLGQREYVGLLAKASMSAAIAGVFLETHPEPDKALSDGPNSLELQQLPGLVEQLVELDGIAKKQ